jgi:hypothetical protein
VSIDVADLLADFFHLFLLARFTTISNTLKGEKTRITNTLPDSQDIIVPHDKTGKPKRKLIQSKM